MPATHWHACSNPRIGQTPHFETVMRQSEYLAHALAEERHWWFVGRRSHLLALLGRVTPPGAQIADLGCGTGGNAAAFAAAGYDVVALDTNPEAIELARARYPDVRFVIGDDPRDAANHLSDGATAVLADVLEHLDDDRGFLERTLDVVGQGGHVVLTVPADPELWGPHDVAFGHRRRYTERTLRSLWADLPVTPRLVSHFNTHLYPLIAGFRRMSRSGPRRAGGDLSVPMGPLNGLFRMIFKSEGKALLSAVDRGAAPYRRGVSLIAVLQRR
jgi:SAM-dependent methyltransferase